MLEFRHAAGATVENVSEIFFTQTVERLLDLVLAECRNRITVVLLIARQRQRVECQRIILRRRDLLFDQRAKDANLDVGQWRHRRIIPALEVPAYFTISESIHCMEMRGLSLSLAES